MSVDTYLKGKNLAAYKSAVYEDVRILISQRLGNWGKALSISSRRFLFWSGLDVEVAPLRPHAHGAT